MADHDLEEICDYLIHIAEKAGEIITSAKVKDVDFKKNSVDLVTEIDQAVESLISKSLREHYPSFSFMGEETYKPGDILNDDPTFEAQGTIVDANPGNWNPTVDGRRYLAVRGGEGQEEVIKQVWDCVEGTIAVGA
ncbi:MAG: hypothetical protein Q9165_001087 [Trypethelium subeluteriae]